jgi:putative ABC transport system permease protein
MRLALLAWASLWNRRGTALLTVLTIAISTALLLAVDQVRTEARSSFASTVSGTDLIVGARTGGIQLLLYTVFRIGEPTYQEFARRPEVAWTVPIALGDSFRGYRVVGTTKDYFEHFRYGARRALVFRAGRPFDDLYDAVLGAEVAENLGLGLGSTLILAHGIGRVGITEHRDKPFTVVGILARTGTPVDRSVHVSLEGIEAIHLDWQGGYFDPRRALSADAARAADLTPKQITAFFVGLKSKVAAFGLQRAVNTYRAEPLTAILPGATLQQLWSLLAVAERALLLIAAMVVVAGLLGMLAVLLATLSQRRREMAILRSVGARPVHVLGLLVLESGLLATLGALLGSVVFFFGSAALAPWVEDRYGLYLGWGIPSTFGATALAAIVASGFVLGLLPGLWAYRRSLADGLAMRI